MRAPASRFAGVPSCTTLAISLIANKMLLYSKKNVPLLWVKLAPSRR
jgi:hypothetical protein